MANTSFQFSIPTPCQQRWAAMHIVDSGRFCDSCQKTVVDFTGMTDVQIARYLSERPEQVCGRFTTRQLNQNLLNRTNTSGYFEKHRWVAVTVAGLLGWNAAQGHSLDVPGERVAWTESQMPTATTSEDGAVKEDKAVRNDTVRTVSGKIITAKEKMPLPGAIVVVKETQMQVSTDENGLFRILLTDYPKDKLTLRVGSVGFIFNEITVKVESQKELTVALEEDDSLLGEIVIVRRPGILYRLKNLFRAK